MKRNDKLYNITLTSIDPETSDLKIHIDYDGERDGTYTVYGEDELHVYDQEDEVQVFTSQDEAIASARRQILQNIRAGH